MDIIDNLIYANCASALQKAGTVATTRFPAASSTLAGGDRITSNYIDSFTPDVNHNADGVAISGSAPGKPDNFGLSDDPVYSYDVANKMAFCSYTDPDVIENTIFRRFLKAYFKQFMIRK